MEMVECGRGQMCSDGVIVIGRGWVIGLREVEVGESAKGAEAGGAEH